MIDAAYGKFREELFLIQQDVSSAFYERAINKLEDLMERFPLKAEPHFEMGRIAVLFGLFDDAKASFQKALELDSDYFPTYIQYAFLLLKMNQLDLAIEILEKSKNTSAKEESEIYFYLGLIYQRMGKKDTAKEWFQKAKDYCTTELQLDKVIKFTN